MQNRISTPCEGARLSVSMIVRNEAKRIPECIASLDPVADEIVILDTGSTDDTVAVVESLGCRVETFVWCDDFSAARNAALAYCRYPWVLSMDADEILAAKDYDRLRALVAEAPRLSYRFITRNYTDDATTSGFVPVGEDTACAADFVGWFPSAKVRLFPNLDTIFFEGIVHELLNNSLARSGIDIADTSIPIHHYPLLNARKGALEAKQKLYLALGKKKVVAYPSDARAHSELGDQYVDMGVYGAAVDAYKMAVALEPTSGRWLKNLGAALYLLGHYPQALRALRLAVLRDPDLEEGWRNLGVVLIRQGAWQEACEALKQALEQNEGHPDNFRYLAIAQQGAGDVSGAITTLERLLGRFPKHAEGRMLYNNLTDEGG